MIMSPKLAGLELVSEYKFHETRGWRADFALIGIGILIELEGIINPMTAKPGEKSRHTAFNGYTNDCIKYSEAAILGWRVIRLTQEMVKSGMGISLIERAVEGR